MKIPGTHPSLAGHFPGSPVIPGVVILDEVIAYISETKERNITVSSIPYIKFLNPMEPDEDFTINLAENEKSKINFSVESHGKTILSGSLVYGCL